MLIMLVKRLLLKKTEEERSVTRRMGTTKIEKSKIMMVGGIRIGRIRNWG